MASVDGSKSLQGASDESYDFICGPCQTDKIHKQANHYCNECREYLCNLCKDVHCKLAITKNHNILSGKKIPVPTSGSQKYGAPVYCGCNKNQEVEFYCEDHHDVICTLCMKVKHRNCEINDLQYKITNYNTQMPNTILTKTKTLKHQYDSMLKQRKSDLKELNGQIEDCRKEIKGFRATIGAFLDKLEVNVLQKLEAFDTKQKQHIGQDISTLTTGLQMLDSDRQQLEDAKNTENKVKMFTTEIQVSKGLQEYETLLTEMENDVYIPALSFVGNKLLTELETEITSLGNLKGIDKSLSHSSKSKSQRKHKNTLLGKKASLQTKRKVRASDDKKAPCISGCTFMPSGHAVLCDRENENVKVLDNDLVLFEYIKTCSWPWDVSVVDDNNVIITLPRTKKLQLIQVFPQLETGRIIQLEKKCDGIQVFGNEIYTTQVDSFGQGEVLVLNLNGSRKRKLQTDVKFYYPRFISVSTSGKKIFVSGGYNDTISVTCMATDGNLVYKYKDKKLRDARGIYVDAEDNILVCDLGSDTVAVITANGEQYATLLTSSDGMDQPYSIAYRETDDTLLVGLHGQDHISIYKML